MLIPKGHSAGVLHPLMRTVIQRIFHKNRSRPLRSGDKAFFIPQSFRTQKRDGDCLVCGFERGTSRVSYSYDKRCHRTLWILKSKY